LVFIEVGPASLVVAGEKNGVPYDFDSARLRGLLETILFDIRDHLPVLRQKAHRIKKTVLMPEVARIMVEAVKAVDEETLTPMAAVAGAVADVLKGCLAAEEVDFISINNGGDISILNRKTRCVTIGLGDIERHRATPYSVQVDGLTDFGVATSGFGGRSFTLGIADMVSVVAASASLADAAATFICNRTAIESEHVLRRRAYEIDPATDIPDEFVTIQVGPLDSCLVAEALEQGRKAAAELQERGVIMDAIVLLRERMVTTIKDGKNIRLEVFRGD
jgi:uncharacterized protein